MRSGRAASGLLYRLVSTPSLSRSVSQNVVRTRIRTLATASEPSVVASYVQLSLPLRRPLSTTAIKTPACNVESLLDTTPLGQLVQPSIDKAIQTIKAKCEAKTADGVSAADRILRRLIAENAKEVTIELVDVVLDCYRTLSSISARDAHQNRSLPDKSFSRGAEELLISVEEASVKLGDHNDCTPGTESYAIVVDAYAKIGNASKAEEILKRIEPKWMNTSPSPDGNNIIFRPNAAIYQAVLNSYARSRRPDSARKAESVLERMDLLYRQGYSSVRPITLQFNAVINALSKSGEPGAAARAEKIIDHMIRLSKDGPSTAPDVRSFNTALHAYAVSREPGAAQKAEALLTRMEELNNRGITKYCSPNTVSYNNVLNAWSKSGEKGAAQRTEKILEHMTKISEIDRSRDAAPNVISYNAVINTWTKSGAEGAAERCEALLKRMEELCAQGSKDVCPDTITYSAVIDAWAKSGKKGAAERAEAILDRTEKLYRQGHRNVRPNVVSYSAVINAYAKSREKGAAKRAEALLLSMNILYEQGVANIRPNEVTYVAVIDAWAKSREKGSAQRAHDILNHMLRLSENGRKDLRPGIASFTAVIDAYAKEGLADEAENLLKRMEHLSETDKGFRHIRPSRISYNVVIKAWARSRKQGSAARAESILNQMVALAERGRRDIFPDKISYSSCIDAYAKSRTPDAFDNAQRLFEKMQELNIKANKVTLNSLLNSLAFSDRPDKAEAAQQILFDMEKSEGIVPDCLSYNAVLRSCACSEGDAETLRRALRVAMETLEALHKSKTTKPSYHSYDLFLTICCKASEGEEYERLAEMAFKLCVSNGLLQDVTLTNLVRKASRPFFQRLVGKTGYVTVKNLPPQWSRNTSSTRTRKLV